MCICFISQCFLKEHETIFMYNTEGDKMTEVTDYNYKRGSF